VKEAVVETRMITFVFQGYDVNKTTVRNIVRF
jgi:hypothetical protein